LGNLTDFLFVILDGRTDANWQGATKGFAGDVAVDGIQAAERTSGGVPYSGTIYTNDNTLGAYQGIVDQNPGQASGSLNKVALLSELEVSFSNALTAINNLPVTTGFNSYNYKNLNGLNTTNGRCDMTVVNIVGGGGSSQSFVSGDACDIFIFRWDSNENFLDGYDGQVKFQGGGGIIPSGELSPVNFINVAGDINSSGGGSRPKGLPNGPNLECGQGPRIENGGDFGGGGYFVGYWLTTGKPGSYESSSLSNAVFVGGWYTNARKFSMTSGTSGVHICPDICVPEDINPLS
jgi:hypothetical protein